MIYNLAICLSSISFFIYFISYFISPFMKKEFKRLDLERIGLITILLELIGSVGLLVGMVYTPILLVASGGLALLMAFALLFRLKYKDSLWVSLPALFYMILNAYIFIETIIR